MVLSHRFAVLLIIFTGGIVITGMFIYFVALGRDKNTTRNSAASPYESSQFTSNFTSHNSYRYWLERAVKERNSNLCNKIGDTLDTDIAISAELNRKSCTADYTIETEDLELCRSLDDDKSWASIRNRCLEGLAIRLQRPDLCDESTLISSLKQRCYFAAKQHTLKPITRN